MSRMSQGFHFHTGIFKRKIQKTMSQVHVTHACHIWQFFALSWATYVFVCFKFVMYHKLMFFSNNALHLLLWHNYCQWCWHFVVVQTYPSLLQKIDPCITMLAIRGNLRTIEYWETALGSQTLVAAKLMFFPQRILAKTFVKHFFLGRNIVSGVDILSWWRHIHLQAMITMENGPR